MIHSIREQQAGARYGQPAATWHARITRVFGGRVWPDAVRAHPDEHQRCEAGPAAFGEHADRAHAKRRAMLAQSLRALSRQPRIRTFLNIVGAVPAPGMSHAQRRIPSDQADAFLIENLIFPRRLIASVAGAALFALLLAGCGLDPHAPLPTVNPHAHRYSHLKITAEPGSGVNRVEVYTTWVIGNLGCAPHRAWSGATIQKQVDTNESVENVDGYYLARILADRFLPGKCRWIGDGYGIRPESVTTNVWNAYLDRFSTCNHGRHQFTAQPNYATAYSS